MPYVCVLLAVLVVSLLIAGGLWLSVGQTARIRRLVARRTRELSESEQRFRMLVDNAGDAFFLHDRNGNILDVNQRACDGLDYTRDELLALKVGDVEMNLQESASHWNYEPSAYPVSFEGVHRRKDGTEFPVEIRLAQIETNGQQLMLALARDISERKEAEKAIRQEQRLLRKLLELHEQDRKLVAYEIHDGLAQQLAAAVYRFQSVRTLEPRNPKAAKEVFDEAMQLLSDAMAESRRLISGLRPPVLDESGVVPAIECLIAERRPQEGLQIEFVHDEIGRLATPLEGSIFRIVQEGMTNVLRHSKSPRLRIELTQRDGRIHLVVRDWGVGFRLDDVPIGHFGLQSIQERARLLGGSATIESSPGQGVLVNVDLPSIPQTDFDP